MPFRFLGQKDQSVNRDLGRRATRVRVTVTYITIDHALTRLYPGQDGTLGTFVLKVSSFGKHLLPLNAILSNW